MPSLPQADLPLSALLFLAAFIGLFLGLLFGRTAATAKSEKLRRALEREIEERRNTHHAQANKEKEIAEERDQTRRLLLTVPDVIKRLSAQLAPDEIPSVLLRLAETLLGAGQVGFFRHEEETGSLLLVEVFALPKDLKDRWRIPVGEGLVGWSAAQRALISNGEAQTMPPLQRQAVGKIKNPPGVLLHVAIPIVGAEGLYGVLAAGKIASWTPDSRRYAAMISDLGGIAFDHAHLIKRVQTTATRDGLTEIYNKRYFDQRFLEERIRCENHSAPLSLLIFDVDNFKHYNDTNGHPEGDKLLKGLASLVRSRIRKSDFVARIGGEEFAVVMSGTKKDEAFDRADELRRAISEAGFPHGSAQPLGVLSISGGVATFPEDGQTCQELLQAADKALYEGKRAGRNRIVKHEGFSFKNWKGGDTPA